MFKRRGSIPADEIVVAKALETLSNQPGGLLAVGPAILSQMAQTMAPQDFDAPKLDLADAQWLVKNADRLDEIRTDPASRDRFRPPP